MTNGNSISGNEFDEFMNPGGGQPGPAKVRTGGKHGGTPTGSPGAAAAKPEKRLGSKKKVVMLGVASVALLALVGVAVVKKGKEEAAAAISPDVAEVMAAAREKPIPEDLVDAAAFEGGHAPLAASPEEGLGQFEGEGAVPLISQPAAGISSAQVEAAAVLPPTAAVASAPTGQAQGTASIKTAPAVQAVAPPAAPATVDDKDGQIQALKAEVARAIAARNRAEVREHEASRRRSGTVVAVLNDGVVIRDAAGNERVVPVGGKVTP